VIVQAKSQVLTCDLDGETALLNQETGIYFGLDEVGSHIWAVLQNPTSQDALVESVLAQYDVEVDQCLRDVRALLEDFRRHGLITASE